MMRRSRSSLRAAMASTPSSTESVPGSGPTETRRSTNTSLVCPIRCTRAMACRSLCGFQSLDIVVCMDGQRRTSPVAVITILLY